MEMHSVANFATLQTPTFFPSSPFKKSTQTLFDLWESLVLPCKREVLLSQQAHTHISLSLCVCSVSVQRTAGKSSTLIQLNTDIMLLASLILNTSIAEITAQLLSLSYVYLISLNGSAIIRIFVQINILEERAGLWA